MSGHAYTEEQLVEQRAKAAGPPSPWSSPSGRGDDGLFAELGWAVVSAVAEFFGRSRGDETHLSPAESQSLLTSSPTICLGRETKGEVVLVSRFRAALERFNPALPPEAITAASSGIGPRPFGHEPVLV